MSRRLTGILRRRGRLRAASSTTVVACLGGALLLLLVLGVVTRAFVHPGTLWFEVFDMDGELNVPAYFSGALLAAAAVVAGFGAPRNLLYRTLAVGLLFAAVDEVASIHERLERFVGTDWEFLYLPVFGAAAVLMVPLLRDLARHGSGAVVAFASGGGGWALAQILEYLEWRGTNTPQPGYDLMMFAEETLESAGSILVIWALLIVSRGNGREQGRPGPRTHVVETGPKRDCTRPDPTRRDRRRTATFSSSPAPGRGIAVHVPSSG